jgi:ABC-type Na+ efflux pump permease subunit
MAFGKMIIFLLAFIVFVSTILYMGTSMMVNQPSANGYYTNGSITTTANSSLAMTEQFMPYVNNQTVNNSTQYNLSAPGSIQQSGPFTFMLVLIIIFGILTFGAGAMFLIRKGGK